jgi:hypothetical protein
VFGVLGVTAALGVSLYLLLWLNLMRAESSADEKVLDTARSAVDAVRKDRPDAREIVARSAEVPLIRNYLYVELKQMGKADLFPISCRTVEKVAESSMVRWLAHANELNGVPSKIELISRVSVRRAEGTGAVFFFRFRSEPPHWAARKGWMMGIAGAYWDGEELPEVASGTFSQFIPLDEMPVEKQIPRLLERQGFIASN